MKLYHWRSKAMKQYGWGHVMASAHSAEEARAAIMSRGKLAYTKNFSSYFDEEDEDDIEALARFLSQLEQDISVDVNPVETVFIAGSE